MAIVLSKGSTKRDWMKLSGAVIEASLRALSLGVGGFAAVVSPLFRAFEAVRGVDSPEKTATRYVLEVIGYAVPATISRVELKRAPERPEIEKIITSIFNRIEILTEQEEVVFDAGHVKNPAQFALFVDAANELAHALKICEPASQKQEIIAEFQKHLSLGLCRVRTRSPEYYSRMFELLEGEDSRTNARVRAWEKYREMLVRRFEDELLFGEADGGTRLGQVYQELRAWWEEHRDDRDTVGTPKVPQVRHVNWLRDLIFDWLASDNKADRVRLVSGGPGSGKSTFAKSLAAELAVHPEWRVVFVPLQRLRGGGPLESRIDEYFRLQGGEPFGADVQPLAGIDRDGHKDWLIIFDGLDELAKEGASSESAAQDFASALADWRTRIGAASVRFLVLGRAPSMQEARRRLGLYGQGTIHVLGMAPLRREGQRHIVVEDPQGLNVLDQRPEFWRKWAIAKGLSLTPPEAMRADELLDLTNEPLLAHLLILSGYVSERWREAAENRNRIYRAIFSQIWARERGKPTRLHLNDLGQECFEALLQALGIAAWRGGGRTGDSATFISVRDIFMRPDLLTRAKNGGGADLGNVALLFYTRKDEEGGSGYEFLHKSFGEYLTACGLFSAFHRWGAQVSNVTSDFDAAEFFRRWLQLTGNAPVTREIAQFLRNEVRLRGSEEESEHWRMPREAIPIVANLFNLALRDGFPAHDTKSTWRVAESAARNAEESLLAVVDAVARAAYPMELLNSPGKGGWTAGPVFIEELAEGDVLVRFLQRMSIPTPGWMADEDRIFAYPGAVAQSMFSRLRLEGASIFGLTLAGVDFSGCKFDQTDIAGCVFVNSNFSGAQFRSCELDYVKFFDCDLSGTIFDAVDIAECEFDEASIGGSQLASIPPSKSRRRRPRKTFFISNRARDGGLV